MSFTILLILGTSLVATSQINKSNLVICGNTDLNHSSKRVKHQKQDFAQQQQTSHLNIFFIIFQRK